MEYFPAVLDRDTSDAAVARWRSRITGRGWESWAAEIRETGGFIGLAGLQVPAAPPPFAPCVEIGRRLGCRSWGHGYATEAARGTPRVSLERLRPTEIVSSTAVGNRRSRAVMERLGMRRAPGTFEHPH